MISNDVVDERHGNCPYLGRHKIRAFYKQQPQTYLGLESTHGSGESGDRHDGVCLEEID